MPTGTTECVEQRILEQSMVIRSRGAVTGWAALRLWGGSFFDGLAPDGRTPWRVPIVANGDPIGPTDGILLDRSRLRDAETAVRFGIRCTTVERALFDEIRRVGDLREAVVAIDMCAAARLTSIARMRIYLTSRRGARGLLLASAALDLADEGSRSPQESRFRQIWEIDAGWGRPLTNRAIYDLGGRFLGTPDLLDPIRGVAGEYDGADHRDRDRHVRDVRREDLFRRAGLEYVEVVGPDLRDRELVVERIHAAGRRAGGMPRGWRLGPQPEALDEILDQADAMRALWDD